jgi:HSP20 family protein
MTMLRDLMTLQEGLNQLFNEGFPRTWTKPELPTYVANWVPSVDIYETDQVITLKADLPDIDPKNVDIRIEDNVLFLKGERKFDSQVKKENFHRSERVYGTFSRSFSLPQIVAADKISADYKNGVLQITMPKREESKPKQIRVNVNS